MLETLLAAGASIVGRTLTDELSRGITGRNAHYGTPVNPAAPEALPGGSSSGSAAAVAGGLSDFGLGTDTGGSVRIPGSFCGLWGLRPTHGSVSLEGVVGQAPSFDTVGWLARDGATLQAVAEVLLGPTDADPVTRFLVPQDLWRWAEQQTADVLRSRFEAALDEPRTAELEVAEGELGGWCADKIVLQQREAWESFAAWLDRAQPRIAWGVARNFFEGAQRAPSELEAAAATRERARRRLSELLHDGTVLCFPTAPFPAPDRNVDGASAAALWPAIAPLTCIAGLTGAPQLTVPVAQVDGRPVGLSLLGPPSSDLALIAAARQLFGSGR